LNRVAPVVNPISGEGQVFCVKENAVLSLTAKGNFAIM
jgi:hypothetical protein